MNRLNERRKPTPTNPVLNNPLSCFSIPENAFPRLGTPYIENNQIEAPADLWRQRRSISKIGHKINIGIVSNGDGFTGPMAIEAVEKKTNNPPQLISYEIPNEINPLALNKEIETVLNYIESNKLYSPENSRAAVFIEIVKCQQLEAPICFSIINKITQITQKLDGIFLLGGKNIPPIWYGSSERSDESDVNCYRTILELALIHEARNKGIPLIGVCRGHQLIYVYHGEKLKNHPGAYAICETQTFNLIKKDQKGLLANLFRETVVSEAIHHQGVSLSEEQNRRGDLEPLTIADEFIKAAESKYGGASPIISTQFHPEMYDPNSNPSNLSKNNESFFQILYESAVSYNNKKKHITPEALIAKRAQLKRRL